MFCNHRWRLLRRRRWRIRRMRREGKPTGLPSSPSGSRWKKRNNHYDWWWNWTESGLHFRPLSFSWMLNMTWKSIDSSPSHPTRWQWSCPKKHIFSEITFSLKPPSALEVFQSQRLRSTSPAAGELTSFRFSLQYKVTDFRTQRYVEPWGHHHKFVSNMKSCFFLVWKDKPVFVVFISDIHPGNDGNWQIISTVHTPWQPSPNCET